MSFVIEADGQSEVLSSDVISRPVKRIAKGSPQQEEFWEELQTGSRHILLKARAGTGKSSSAREGMHRLLENDPSLAIQYCCFNKKIADEFRADCPSGVIVSTMHSLGLSALQNTFGSQLETDKTYTLIDRTDGGPDLKKYIRKSIWSLVAHAKNHALRPDMRTESIAQAMLDFAEFYDVNLWGRNEEEIIARAIQVFVMSAETTGTIDYDDMLWLPVIHNIEFPNVDMIFCDEAQDLNHVQHEMLEHLSGSGRTIVIADPAQAIYGWRGAATDSVERLQKRLDAQVLPLTVSWRCPRSHVVLARQLVPDFQAAPNAIEGTIKSGTPEAIDDALPGDLVLCRTNAPIISACLQQIARQRPAIVRGRAIGDQLVTIFRNVERFRESKTAAEFTRNLALWRGREIARLEAKDGTEQKIETVQDQTDCLDALTMAGVEPTEIPSAISRLFSDDTPANRITFSSVHRAKGSEAKRVAYIQVPYSEKRDKFKPPMEWELQQRSNLKYVALTRSLDTLTLIS